MKTYTDRTTAPLIFHDLNRYVRLPISICIQAFSIYGLIYGFTWQWFDYYDLSFAMLFLVLFIIAFIGCMKWRPSAWYALIALSALGITYNILYLLLFGTILESSDYVKPLVQIVGDICVTIYYLKRKPLFFSSMQPEKEKVVSSATASDSSINNDPLNSQPLNDSTNEGLNANEISEQEFENTIPFNLFKRIQFMAEGFCDDITIFPYGATLKDKEVAYTYVYFLYSTANVKHNYFDKQIFTDALSYINYTFKTIYNYTDEMLENMYYLQREKLESFITIHAEYIDTEDIQEANLFGYTENIIAQFQNASFEDPVSVDNIFAEFFYKALEDIEAFKEEISTWESNKKEDHPLGYISNITKPKKFFCKENTPLILCIIVLIGSLAGNIYQSSLNQALSQELSNSADNYADLKGDYEDAIESRDNYRHLLYDMSDEYNFYHNGAVIVTDYDSYYHAYGCEHINGKSYWIYNIKAAISQGYKPCPTCDPPQ